MISNSSVFTSKWFDLNYNMVNGKRLYEIITSSFALKLHYNKLNLVII